MNSKIGILLVLYKSSKYIRQLLTSISLQTYRNIKLYIIDNFPEESSLSLFQNCEVDKKIVDSLGNIGYAAANNILAKIAIEENCRYLFILNPDVELEKNCLSVLLDILESKSETGSASCVVLHGKEFQRTDIIQSFGVSVNYYTGEKKLNHSGELFSKVNLKKTEGSELLFGGAFMIRSEIVNKISLFEERYFMYNDELDLAYRLNALKVDKIVTSQTCVWHHHDFTSKNVQGNIIMYYYMMRNKYLYYSKFGFYSSMVIDLMKQAVMAPLTIRWLLRLGGAKLVLYYFLGIINGLKGEQGKTNLGIHR